MKQHLLLPCLVLMLVLGLAVSPALALSSPDRSSQAASTSAISPGNYCVSCHLADDPRLAAATKWQGSIQREANSPCPAAAEIHKELYYTERMLLMIGRAKETTGSLPDKTQLQLDGYTQSYSRQLDQPVTSLEAFSTEAQTIRYRLNKVYAVLNQMVENQKKRTVLLSAVAISVIVLGSLVWGLFNTRSYKGGTGKKRGARYAAGIFLLLVIGIVALPIFRVPAAEVASSTVEQQEAQAIRDTADRAATAADRGQARAWMLARLGKEWNTHNPSQALELLDAAALAAQQVRDNQDALWGQSLAVQEAGAGTGIKLEQGLLIASDLTAARARMWSVPLIAVQWSAVDPQQAVSLLQAEQAAVKPQTGIYRDLQLRSVALAWASTSPWQAAPAASEIDDPAIRSWTQREIAARTRQPEVFEAAAYSARLIEDPVQRARALREAAIASGNQGLFDEALLALEEVSGAPLAYALSDLAAASGNADLVEDINAEYPDALASVLLRLGEYPAAWDASIRISDPIEQARAQAAIAAGAENVEWAGQIRISLYRDLALRDIIRKTGNATLTGSIGSLYYRVQALTALGDYDAAVREGAALGEGYPLVELSLSLVDIDPQAALQLMDQMTREADKAVVLKSVAAATGDQETFEQALGMALAARVSGDPLAPAQASLDLANALWVTNPDNARAALQQACEAAQKITIK